MLTLCSIWKPLKSGNVIFFLLFSTSYPPFQAFLAALRSKDPVTKVGACIVNQEKKIVGIGYNGFPIGCSDLKFPWSKDTIDPLNSKYLYVCHAEVNAILNKNSADTKGCDIYVALFPCNGCAKMIIQSRIKKVIYFSDKYADKPSTIASKKLLDAAGVEYVKFTSSTLNGRIDLNFPMEIDHSISKLDLNDTKTGTLGYLCWADYFMSIAVLTSYRSKVVGSQMGACIINSENRIVGKWNPNQSLKQVLITFSIFFHRYWLLRSTNRLQLWRF